MGRGLTQTSRTVSSPPSYETKYYAQLVDHTNQNDSRTFQQRYLYSDGEWDGKGPLFVYTGNEGDITWFFNNTVSVCREILGSEIFRANYPNCATPNIAHLIVRNLTMGCQTYANRRCYIYVNRRSYI